VLERRGSLGLPLDGRPAVVTVGTFDGVHVGHWAVLQEIGARARARNGRSILVTFEPHPLRVVRPDEAPPLLTTREEKCEILAESGLEYVVFLSFTQALREMSPQRFVREVLLDKLGMDELVIGYDHGFGRGRSGDVDTLRQIASEEGFRLDVVDQVEVEGGLPSSSAVRRALQSGEIEAANLLLGRPYGLRGLVVQGEARGRTLGFPTANLDLGGEDKLIPAPGIYAVRVHHASGHSMGALHLGPRPTFPGSPPTVEVFLLDFEGDLYGQVLRLDFLHHLRSVQPFTTVAALIAQMDRDVARARELLGQNVRRE